MLKDVGITIPTRSTFFTLHHQIQMEALKNADSLILVTWEFDGNTRQEEHPLMIELKQLYKKEWDNHFKEDEKPNLHQEKARSSILNRNPITSSLMRWLVLSVIRRVSQVSMR